MNIQCGEKRRKETVSSAVRATLAVDKAIPRLVFQLSYPSHKTLQRCLLTFFLFVLMCRLEGRIVGLRMQAQRPLANGGGKDRISHSQDEDGGQRRKERRVDYKVMRRGDTTDREQE